MLSNILASIICDQFNDKVRGRQGLKDNMAMLIRFSLYHEAPCLLDFNKDAERYPARELMIWSPHGISVAVLTRDTLLHPKEESDWYLLSCHDSCWREDGVRRLIERSGDHLAIISNMKAFTSWYQLVEVTDEVRNVVTTRHQERKWHPLFK